ncbi:protein-L-isoaspartate(D-aspartate) O-methyltransferase [Nocardiopsis mwathae]|uniref:Protein-L-isoaspartate O-methyltransferase n=1 Tax=Nocardiopsis mwathae TaxID=1472723 RepID=A0A7W9YHL9_9ACTN|nr:methyltransferase domain-containing protein [Nocardiopsis mwathae]MBB6172125.1 protein-L-isoaspartate(D-aspartate) O-methyltransferase [Nocardiopsis mwathae]
MSDDPPGPDDLAALARPAWADTFRTVPREHFIPDAAHASYMGDEPSHWIDCHTGPKTWKKAVYSDTTILTQVDDGQAPLTEESATTSINPSSSNTAPSLVAQFLELLDPYPGDRVLEIGTGTGWTAALLSARQGAENVYSVEVDEHVAEQAAANVKRAGYAPHLRVGDGAQGWPEEAPFDRVHVTCGVREIPYAWVEQTRPGGVIVAPWTPVQAVGHKLVLTAAGDVAVGRPRGRAGFMMMRSQRAGYPTPVGERRESVATVDPMRISRAGPGLEMAVAAFMPGVAVNGLGSGDDRVGLRHPATGSYALAVRSDCGVKARVGEHGPRSLWPEFENAYLEWLSWGSPGLDRFGVAVTSEGQSIWLDHPDNPIGKV